MKAMIFAAGKGSRMGALTQTTPKPLLDLGPYTLIERHLYRLSELKIKECVINLRYLGDKIENHLGSGSRYGLTISYSHEPCDLETGGGVIHALPLLGDEPFILLSGDIITDFDFSTLELSPQKLAHIVLVPNPPHHPEGDFYLKNSEVRDQLPHDGGKLTKYTYGNIGIYHPKLFKNHPKGHQKLAAILKQGINCQQITGEIYHGHWLNVDTPERLATAKIWCKHGR